MEVRLISTNGMVSVDSEKAQVDQVGQKGLGLLKIPNSWTLPFFAIVPSVFTEYAKGSPQTKKEVIRTISDYAANEFLTSTFFETDTIIIRSSGVKEGLSSRGQYESAQCKTSRFGETLSELFDDIIKENPKLPSIAYLIQPYVKPLVSGHLSNERRFTKVKRDWIYEYAADNCEETSGKIPLRSWRTPYTATGTELLSCHHAQEIKLALKTVAEYFTGRQEAMHFEFLWDGSKIIIVQADKDDTITIGENPTALDITVKNAEQLSNLQVIRPISKEDLRFSKVANVCLYQSAGLKTVPLYILCGERALSQIRQKKLSPELEQDLRMLSKHSIVIRADIATDDQSKKQLLHRSNELRSYDKVIEWLFSQESLLNSTEDVAFLFHIFVPARAAAFVKASPLSRIVEIEALWGLPEGLYFNAHDKIIADTKLIDSRLVTEDTIDILKKIPSYKEIYIAPNEQGEWVPKKTAAPHDWNVCISDDSVRQIALESRKIAALAQQQVSVMWFVGIDKAYYKTPNLAWFHEPYTPGSYTDRDYKKKHFYEKDTLIHDEESLSKFLADPSIKQVRICPVKETLLRNKEFLKEIGSAAAKRGATIILEGTRLAHALYQLQRTNAQVIIPGAEEEYGLEEIYNKLVRDKIPQKIIDNGESIECCVLDKPALLRALLEKAVEEAYEIAAATCEDELKEELCDGYEVLASIQSILSTGITIDQTQFKKKILNGANFSHSFLLTSITLPLLEGYYTHNCKLSTSDELQCTLSYERTTLQLELHFSREVVYQLSGKSNEQTKSLPREVSHRLLDKAFELSCIEDPSVLNTCVDDLLALIIEIEKGFSDCSLDDFKALSRAKLHKRGGFEKGYLLKSSSLQSSLEAWAPPEAQQSLSLPDSGYRHIPLLDYHPIKNVDFLSKNGGELVVRISLPVCFNSYQTVLDSTSAMQYLGKGNSLIMDLKRINSSLQLNMYLRKGEGDPQQIEL